MPETIADKDYFLDSDGNVTTDSTKAANWLVKKDGAISVETQEKYNIPTASKEEGSSDVEEKSEAPKQNKAAKPAKNKGAK